MLPAGLSACHQPSACGAPASYLWVTESPLCHPPAVSCLCSASFPLLDCCRRALLFSAVSLSVLLCCSSLCAWQSGTLSVSDSVRPQGHQCDGSEAGAAELHRAAAGKWWWCTFLPPTLLKLAVHTTGTQWVGAEKVNNTICWWYGNCGLTQTIRWPVWG